MQSRQLPRSLAPKFVVVVVVLFFFFLFFWFFLVFFRFYMPYPFLVCSHELLLALVVVPSERWTPPPTHILIEMHALANRNFLRRLRWKIRGLFWGAYGVFTTTLSSAKKVLLLHRTSTTFPCWLCVASCGHSRHIQRRYFFVMLSGAVDDCWKSCCGWSWTTLQRMFWRRSASRLAPSRTSKRL